MSDELRYIQDEAAAAGLAGPCPGCGYDYSPCDCPAEVELFNGLVGEGYRVTWPQPPLDEDEMPF